MDPKTGLEFFFKYFILKCENFKCFKVLCLRNLERGAMNSAAFIKIVYFIININLKTVKLV